VSLCRTRRHIKKKFTQPHNLERTNNHTTTKQNKMEDPHMADTSNHDSVTKSKWNAPPEGVLIVSEEQLLEEKRKEKRKKEAGRTFPVVEVLEGWEMVTEVNSCCYQFILYDSEGPLSTVCTTHCCGLCETDSVVQVVKKDSLLHFEYGRLSAGCCLFDCNSCECVHVLSVWASSGQRLNILVKSSQKKNLVGFLSGVVGAPTSVAQMSRYHL
jgi:hypothetical protein